MRWGKVAKQNFYITKAGCLRRQHDTIRFEHEEGHRFLPVKKIEALYVFASVDFNTHFVDFLAQQAIPMHIFNYYGWYSGSFLPRNRLISGPLVIKQAVASDSPELRLPIAKEMLNGAAANLLKNIRQFRRNGDLHVTDEEMDGLHAMRSDLKSAASIAELMGIEGVLRRSYYGLVDRVMAERAPDFVMDTRVKRPPNNKMNALISFVNSLVYATTLNQIFRTHLHPAISFLHEPQDRRYSLSLDLSEVFKPLLADRLIFRLIHLKMLNKHAFDESEGICYLSEKGRKKVLEAYHERLNATIHHRGLGRKVSYERLIRLECYKLVKDLLGEKPYSSFKMWW